MSDEENTDEPDSIPLSDLRSDLETDEEDSASGTGPDSKEGSGQEPTREPAEDTATEDSADSIPLSGLRDEVDRQSGSEDAPTESTAETFVEKSVDPVDSEGVWADLLMEDENPEGSFKATEVEEGAGAEETTQVISKRICERCPYLDAPPVLQCTHEGTTIHELVDVDHVRVSSCPMVGPDGEKKTDRSTPIEES